MQLSLLDWVNACGVEFVRHLHQRAGTLSQLTYCTGWRGSEAGALLKEMSQLGPR